MNAPVAISRAAEGYDRKAWTVAEIQAMQRAGLIDQKWPYELIEGELIPKMASKNNPHEMWKHWLDRFLQRGLPDHIAASVEPTLYLDEATYVEPDILVRPYDILPSDVRGGDVLLAVEISDTTLRYDLNLKAQIYARFGVRHYWVLDAEKERLFAHSQPTEAGYAEVAELGPEAVLTLPFEPALSFTLRQFG